MRRLDSEAIVNSIVDIEKIHPHPKNYMIHHESQIIGLEHSHREFGQYRSVVLWAQPDGEYVQVAGHGYVEAARKKEKRIRADILPVNTDPATIEAIMIADNAHAKKSQENLDLLSQLIQGQQQSGANLLALGSSEKEAEALFRRMNNSHAADFLNPIIQATPNVPEQPPSAYQSLESVEGDQEEDDEDGSEGYHFPPSADSSRLTVSPSAVAPVNDGLPHTSEHVDTPQQWFAVTYTVNFQQREILLSAIRLAKQRWSLETSAEAIVQICQEFTQVVA